MTSKARRIVYLFLYRFLRIADKIDAKKENIFLIHNVNSVESASLFARSTETASIDNNSFIAVCIGGFLRSSSSFLSFRFLRRKTDAARLCLGERNASKSNEKIETLPSRTCATFAASCTVLAAIVQTGSCKLC